MPSDPEQERQRLAQLCAAITAEELEKIASDAASLTDAARETLKTEIARRALAITMDESPAGVDRVEGRELVWIQRFRDLPEALLAKGILNSAGIECFLTDDNMVRMDWGLVHIQLAGRT